MQLACGQGQAHPLKPCLEVVGLRTILSRGLHSSPKLSTEELCTGWDTVIQVQMDITIPVMPTYSPENRVDTNSQRLHTIIRNSTAGTLAVLSSRYVMKRIAKPASEYQVGPSTSAKQRPRVHKTCYHSALSDGTSYHVSYRAEYHGTEPLIDFVTWCRLGYFRIPKSREGDRASRAIFIQNSDSGIASTANCVDAVLYDLSGPL